jgi:hypothetical protein
MIHPHTELRLVNETIGHGVFATRFIPRGTIIWVRDEFDQSFTREEFDQMTEPYRRILEKYSYVDARGHLVLCWDHSRYFNHSCNANCLGAGYDFEIAVRDIRAGEELTDDYGTLNLREPFLCLCGHPTCRGRIAPDDMIRHADRWDALVQAAFVLIPQAAQPLWPLLKEKVEVEQALKHPAQFRSIRCSYAPPDPQTSDSARTADMAQQTLSISAGRS